MTGRLLHWNTVATNDGDDAEANVDNGDDGEEGGNDGEGRKRKLASSSTTSLPPYVAVIEEENYTSDNIAKLISYSSRYTATNDYGSVQEGPGRPLQGVLVLASNATTSNSNDVQFSSPDSLTPQGQGTPSASLTIGTSYQWNVNNNGHGLMNTDMYGLPTVYVYDVPTSRYLSNVAIEQSNALSTSQGSENESTADDDGEELVYPAILSEFNYYMGPGGEVDNDGNEVYNSQKCLGWKDTNDEWNPRCAPLGGNSVWSVAGSPLPLDYTAAENGNGDGEGENGNNNNSNKPTILIATSIDSTSMFHDLSPGANNAASNILTVLMAANLLGSTVTDSTFDELYGRITFAFFQGESYGYIGSRRFLKDVLNGGFDCTAGNDGVPSVYKRKDEATVVRSCLHPLRQDLTFQNLGEVRGMIAVDQVGNLGGTKNMYVHGGQKTDGGSGFATFVSEVLVELSTASDDNNGYTAQASSVQEYQDEEDGSSPPLPPTPLSSLVQLSNSGIGGAILTGYDDAYIANSLYHSHLDSTSMHQTIDKDAIASAATLVARSAIAAAYQNANDEVDAETAAAYALELLPNAVDSSSDTFTKLYDCFFVDGNCETLLTYGEVERTNDKIRTGSDLGMGVPLEKPPNYYVSIYDSSNGQAFVRVGDKYYGSLIGGEKDDNGEVIENYGKYETDVFLVRPSLLEMSLFGLLNDFLGRGSFVLSDEEGVDTTTPNVASCKSSVDCSSVSYCDTDSSALAVPMCAGGSCVCGSRSHYHPALDESLLAATNLGTGRFVIQDDDEGISALYTEPKWSSYVGVRIYNDVGSSPGAYAASIGAAFALVCIGIVWRLKKTMVKEKVY